RYYASADLDPEGEFKVLRTDGIPGLEGTYLGKSGLKYRIRCYLRMNRLYLLGMTLPEDDADSAVVDRVFESLRFLPVQQTKFNVAVKEPLQYEAMFPGKPNRIRRWTVPEALEGSVDSAWSNLYHDPATSLNTQVTAAHVWKYYSGDDRSLLANAAKTTERDSAHIVRERSFEAEVWNAHELVLMSYDSTMLDHRQWVVSGDYLLEARVQTTNDAAGESTAKRFFEQFRSLALPLKVGSHKDAHLGPKLQLILAEDEDDTDSLFSDFGTFLNISRYKLRPEEYGMVLDSVRSDRDTMPYSNGEQLLSLLLDTNDSTLLPSLQSLYTSLPATSPKRMTIVGSLLERDWEGASAWALARLHDDPSPLAYADLSFSWRDYLRDDSTHARLDSIAFLLDKPEFALDLAGTMAMWGTDADADYRAYIGSFQRILTAAIDGFDPKDDKIWQKAFHMDYMLLYLATNDVMGWRSLAHRMLMLDATYLPGSAFALLAESGDRMSKKEIQRVLQSRDSRQTALSWVLDNQRLDMLPAKYRDHSFIAAVALDVALEDYPAQVELVEKRKITYKDEPQWLYIYRFAFDGETDWTLGFSGPFPLNGDPESSYFDLAGSNWEEYHPNSYVKKTKAWVREMEEYAEE
ncbi:MAG TPA: hypothetical protein VHS96_16650, partial [Bacteroidia bacterium]|nr:hypothetical protein [Bacteroidia bacterium]